MIQTIIVLLSLSAWSWAAEKAPNNIVYLNPNRFAEHRWGTAFVAIPPNIDIAATIPYGSGEGGALAYKLGRTAWESLYLKFAEEHPEWKPDSVAMNSAFLVYGMSLSKADGSTDQEFLKLAFPDEGEWDLNNLDAERVQRVVDQVAALVNASGNSTSCTDDF